jgi:hypothetical protein
VRASGHHKSTDTSSDYQWCHYKTVTMLDAALNKILQSSYVSVNRTGGFAIYDTTSRLCHYKTYNDCDNVRCSVELDTSELLCFCKSHGWLHYI